MKEDERPSGRKRIRAYVKGEFEMQGKVVIWNRARGFGFVATNFRDRYFFHVTHWIGQEEPMVGQIVTFELGPGQTPEKPPRAVNVLPVPIEEKPRQVSAADILGGSR